MPKWKNEIRNSNLSYILFIILLLFSGSFLAGELRFNPKIGEIYVFPLVSFFVLFILSIIFLRGLTYKIRYSFYGATITLLLVILSFVLNGLYHLIYSYPLIVVTLYSLYMLVKNNKYYNFPTRFFDKPEVSISLVIILAVLLYGILGSLILGPQFRPGIHNIATAFYYTGTVVTTLGLGDIVPITEASRIFTVTLAIFGLGSFFGASTIIIAPFMYNRSRRVIDFLGKLESRKLENYVLFVGFSPLVDLILENLLREKELVVIGLDDQSMEKSLQEKGAFVEIGKNLEDAIKSFDLTKTKMIILASSDDGKNVLNALHINSLYPKEVKEKMISLVNETKNGPKLIPLVSSVVDPSVLIAQSVDHFLEGKRQK